MDGHMDWLTATAGSLLHWLAGLTAPQATLVSAFVVGSGVIVTLLQKQRSDRRNQWWSRVEWSIDHVIEGADDIEQSLGWAAIGELGKRRVATRSDRRFLLSLATAFTTADTTDDDTTTDDDDDDDDEDTTSSASTSLCHWAVATGTGAVLGWILSVSRTRHAAQHVEHSKRSSRPRT